MPILRNCVEMGLRGCRSPNSLLGLLALDFAVLVGTGVSAGAKHSRPASRAQRGTTRNSVDADHTRYPSSPNPLFSRLFSRIPIVRKSASLRICLWFFLNSILNCQQTWPHKMSFFNYPESARFDAFKKIEDWKLLLQSSIYLPTFKA